MDWVIQGVVLVLGVIWMGTGYYLGGPLAIRIAIGLWGLLFTGLSLCGLFHLL